MNMHRHTSPHISLRHQCLIALLWICTLLPTLVMGQGRTHAPVPHDEVAQRRLSYYYLAAQRQKTAGNHTATSELLRHCLAIDPTHPAVNYELAIAHFRLGEDSLGLLRLLQAVKHDSRNTSYLEILSTAYQAMNLTDDAIQVLDKISKLQSKRTDILAQLFQLHKNAGHTAEAIHVLDRMQTLQGNNTRIALQKHALYMEQKDTVRAFQQLQDLCREFPYDAISLILLGDQYLGIHKADSALHAYQRAERINPHSTMLQESMLNYYLEVGDSTRYEHVRDSIILDTQADLAMRINCMRILALDASQQPALRDHVDNLFRTLLADEQAPVQFLRLYVGYMAYTYKQDQEQLMPIMERMLRVAPDDLTTLQDMLRYYVNKNDALHIADLCQKAITTHPTELIFHYFLSVAYLQQQKPNDLIIQTLQTGIRQANESTAPQLLGDLYAVLGDVYHQQGLEAKAFEAYDSCLAYHPDNATCLNNYAYYLSLQGTQLDKAEQMSYRSIKLEPTNKTFLDTYAWTLFIQEDYTTARIYIDKVIQPTREDSLLMADADLNTTLLEHAGDIYAQCGLADEAVRLWTLARQKTPEAKQPLLSKKIKKRKYIRK